MAFTLGQTINLNAVLAGGPTGVLLGVLVLIITGTVCIAADRLLGGSGIAGAAASSSAGNAAAVPAAIALADATYAHIAPVATVQVAAAIALEATLSFLGLGLPITEPSLGLLIANGYQYLLSGKYWISFFPGIALVLTIVSINLVADQLRDVLNPRLAR